MDIRISDLAYIPGPINPATSYMEVAYPDGSSPTGFTSFKAKVQDVASLPVLGLKEIGVGNSVDGGLTSYSNLTYDDAIKKLAINAAGASVYFNNNSISDATTRLAFSRGNIGIGELVGSPSFAALYMAVSPTSSNYTLATSGASLIVNGVGDINFSVGNSSKMVMNSAYTQHYMPFSIGSLVPTGAQLFVVNGQTYMKGVSTSNSDYIIKGQDSASSPLFNVSNAGLATIATNGIGAARLEIVGGVYQGAYIQTSGTIGVNTVDNTGFANKSETVSGTAFRGNTTGAGYAIDLNYTPTNKTIFRAHYNGTNSIPHTPNMQIGNAGLSVGDWYVDTAANILANSDLMIGVKQ